jgi:hypothetical protein
MIFQRSAGFHIRRQQTDVREREPGGLGRATTSANIIVWGDLIWMMPKYFENIKCQRKSRVNFGKLSTIRANAHHTFWRTLFMKNALVGFTLILSLSTFVSICRADIAIPGPHHSPRLPPHPRHSPPKVSPSASPTASGTGLTQSAPVSEASPDLTASGMLVAFAGTGALVGIVLVRKRNDQP